MVLELVCNALFEVLVAIIRAQADLRGIAETMVEWGVEVVVHMVGCSGGEGGGALRW